MKPIYPDPIVSMLSTTTASHSKRTYELEIRSGYISAPSHRYYAPNGTLPGRPQWMFATYPDDACCSDLSQSCQPYKNAEPQTREPSPL